MNIEAYKASSKSPPQNPTSLRVVRDVTKEVIEAVVGG
jgi:hypothetical protein